MSHSQTANKKRKKRHRRRNKNKHENQPKDAYVIQQQQQQQQEQQAIAWDIDVKEDHSENDDALDEIAQADMNFRETEMMLLQTDNCELKKDNLELKQQLAKAMDEIKQLEQNHSLEQKTKERCYVRNEVIGYNPKDKSEITIRDNIKQQQTDIHKEMAVHEKRLNKWNEFSTKLQNQFEKGVKQPNLAQIDVSNDEKKQPPQNNDNHQTAIELLNSYTNCMKLLQVQKSRIEDIGEYVITLNKSKKSLKKTVKAYNVNEQPLNLTYKQLCASYTDLKSRREHLQEKVKNMVDEINKITEEENQINKQKCDKLDCLNISVFEKEKYDTLLDQCKSLIQRYNVFDKSIDDKSDELEKYFGEKWDNHQRLWAKWNVDDIICWIQYLAQHNKIQLSKEINFKTVAQEMNNSKFKGKNLSKLEKNDLKLFGIVVFDDYQQIWSMVRKLVEKYPNIIAEDNANNDDIEGGVQITAQGVSIPKEYLCPITKKIMFHPVIYDGITYERTNLEEYLAKYKKIPGTDEPYDEDEEMTKNRKLKQKIDAFLDVNPQFINEGV